MNEQPEQPQRRTVWGITCFHSETGTEGGYWAVQDCRGMQLRDDGLPAWSYYGLEILQDGDILTIYAPESVRAPRPPEYPNEAASPGWEPVVLWEGEIRLQQYPVFTADADGWWIHADQQGVDRLEWAGYFLREHPCRLETSRPLTVIGQQSLPEQDYDGFFYDRPSRLYFLIDGTVRWNLGGYPDAAAVWRQPPYPLLRYLARRGTKPT